MNDYLRSLVHRSKGLGPLVQPRLPSSFEPVRQAIYPGAGTGRDQAGLTGAVSQARDGSGEWHWGGPDGGAGLSGIASHESSELSSTSVGASGARGVSPDPDWSGHGTEDTATHAGEGSTTGATVPSQTWSRPPHAGSPSLSGAQLWDPRQFPHESSREGHRGLSGFPSRTDTPAGGASVPNGLHEIAGRMAQLELLIARSVSGSGSESGAAPLPRSVAVSNENPGSSRVATPGRRQPSADQGRAPAESRTNTLQPSPSGRPLASSVPTERPSEPTVKVTIGRVEVRAVPPSIPRARPVPKARTMSLEEYLRKREGGRR
jgi:hypothetical protein